MKNEDTPGTSVVILKLGEKNTEKGARERPKTHRTPPQKKINTIKIALVKNCRLWRAKLNSKSAYKHIIWFKALIW